MTEKTALEIGIYIAIIAFLLTIVALVDTVKNDNKGISFQNDSVIEQSES